MKYCVLVCLCAYLALAAAAPPVKEKEIKKEEQCTAVHTGCSVDSGECVCGEAIECHNPFPYKDIKQCKKDLKGMLDKCKKEPCEHGQCVQAKKDQSRRWVCSCSGSGYYGKKCELECPPYEEGNVPEDYPSDCIY